MRICRFVPLKRELRFEWIEELAKDEIDIMIDRLSTRMVHMNITDEIRLCFDTEQEEENLTAQVFGIRAFGKCYAFQVDGSNINPRTFPPILRKWGLIESTVGKADFYDEFDYGALDQQSMDEYDELRIRRFRTSMMENEFMHDTPYNIQYIYANVGYTPMSRIPDCMGEDSGDVVITQEITRTWNDPDEEDEDHASEEDDDGDDYEIEEEEEQDEDEMEEEEQEEEIEEEMEEVTTTLPLIGETRMQRTDESQTENLLINATIILPDDANPQIAQETVSLLLHHLGEQSTEEDGELLD